MGRAKRIIPKNLPIKLKKIRSGLNLSLEGMVKTLEDKLVELGYSEIRLYSGNVYEFETGKREPLLPVILAYARTVSINCDILIDNELDLPKNI